MTPAHRVTWFAPKRPVDGGTIFVRPDTPETPMNRAELDRVARRAGLPIPKETPMPAIPDPLNPDPDETNCTCGSPSRLSPGTSAVLKSKLGFFS